LKEKTPMKDDYLKLVASLIGLLVSLGALAGLILNWSNQPQLLQIVALLGYIVSAGEYCGLLLSHRLSSSGDG